MFHYTNYHSNVSVALYGGGGDGGKLIHVKCFITQTITPMLVSRYMQEEC